MTDKRKVADMAADFQDHIRRRDRYIRQLELDRDFPPIPLYAPALPDGKGTDEEVMSDVVDRTIASLVLDWLGHVEEPPHESAEWIDRAIRTRFGSNWTWEEFYAANGQLAWCGHGQAPAERAAGLSDEVILKRLQSCHRLRTFAREFDLFVPVDEMRRGDIVLVDTMGTPEKSDHITRCWMADSDEVWPDEFWDAVMGATEHAREKYFDRYVRAPHYLTLEGNAKGLGPDGSVYEGLVARLRPLSTVREVISIDRRFYDV